MEIIVGSTALDHFGLSRRKPQDIDIWSDVEKDHIKGYDYALIPLDILKLVETENYIWSAGSGQYEADKYATPNSVYTIKCSHAAYDIHWEKTKGDILWLKAKGCKLIPDLYQALLVFWKAEHGNKDFLSLNKSKAEFFNDYVDYKYDHDYLHQLVAWPNPPMYSKVLLDGQEVLFDKAKFFALPFEDQIRCFREEMAVIACERWVLPSNGQISWFKAHGYSLRKTVTTLTKGWASQFIIENLEHFVKPQYNYVENLLNTLQKENETK